MGRLKKVGVTSELYEASTAALSQTLGLQLHMTDLLNHDIEDGNIYQPTAFIFVFRTIKVNQIYALKIPVQTAQLYLVNVQGLLRNSML